MQNDSDYAVESWRPVVGYEGQYEVSNMGNVRSLTRETAYKGGVRVRAGRTLRPQKHPFGYLSVTLCNGGAKSIQRIHTLVARAFIGEKPTENHVVAHNNGVANDNRLQNLRYATQSENLLDMRLHGTSLRGERNGNTPLSPEDVLAMRKARGQGALLRELAQYYGVCESTVSGICNRLTWKHL